MRKTTWASKMQCLQVDKGREYMFKEFIDYMLEHGITCQYTVRACP
jgi:hypothetical protein